MKLNRIHCQNFFSHKDTDLNFKESGSPVLITGDNGAGKSSAVSEALTYAIFGEVRVESIDDVIRDNEDEMCVAIEFEMNGQDISITRRKKRGKSQKLIMFINQESVSELASETQNRINKLFGLSYDSFRSSVILRQEDSDFFVNQKPDDRKKIIAEILDLNAYERLEKLARERRQELKSEVKAEQNVLSSLELEDIEELQTDLLKVEDYLSKYPLKIAKAQAKLDEITAKNTHIKDTIARHEKALQNYRALDIKVKSYKADLERKQDELEQLKSGTDLSTTIKSIIKDIDEKEIKYKDLSVKEKQLQAEYNKIVEQKVFEQREKNVQPCKETVAIFQKNIEEHEANLKKARKAGLQCDSCNRPFEDANERQQYIDGIEDSLKKLKDKFEKELNKLNDALDVLKKYKLGDFPDAVAMLENLTNYTEQYEKLGKQIVRLRTEQATNQELQRKYEVAQSRKESLRETIATLNETIADLIEQQNTIDVVPLVLDNSFIDETEPRGILNSLRNSEKSGLVVKSQLEQRIATGLKMAERHKTITEGLNNKLYRLSMLEKLCIAFSRKGVPAAIIETVLPEIQDTANKYLDKMSESTLGIRFNTLATLKNGEQRETLEIEVFDGNNWRIFESYSGGEKFRVSLSIRLALSHILALRAGIDLELLILDEPASPLDPIGREIFVSTIKSLATHFSRIILISHLQDLQEEFEYRINLAKSESATKVL